MVQHLQVVSDLGLPAVELRVRPDLLLGKGRAVAIPFDSVVVGAGEGDRGGGCDDDTLSIVIITPY